MILFFPLRPTTPCNDFCARFLFVYTSRPGMICEGNLHGNVSRPFVARVLMNMRLAWTCSTCGELISLRPIVDNLRSILDIQSSFRCDFRIPRRILREMAGMKLPFRWHDFSHQSPAAGDEKSQQFLLEPLLARTTTDNSFKVDNSRSGNESFFFYQRSGAAEEVRSWLRASNLVFFLLVRFEFASN